MCILHYRSLGMRLHEIETFQKPESRIASNLGCESDSNRRKTHVNDSIDSKETILYRDTTMQDDMYLSVTTETGIQSTASTNIIFSDIQHQVRLKEYRLYFHMPVPLNASDSLY